MPIQFLGMVRTNNISEIHGAGPTTGENVIDPPFLRDFFRAHDQNNFDRVLIGYHSTAPDGWPIASFGAAECVPISSNFRMSSFCLSSAANSGQIFAILSRFT